MPALPVSNSRRLRRQRSRALSALAGLAGFALAFLAPVTAAPRTAPSDPTDVPVVNELSDALREPSRSVHVPFEFTVVVREVDRTFEPYLTLFDPHTWMCVEAWSDDMFLWRRDHFARSSPCLFVRRDSPAARALLERRPYERVAVTGLVRQVFAGRPWIEVWDARVATEHLTEPTIFHAARAIELFEQGRADLAESEMERALAAPLPLRQRTELERVRDSFRPER